MSDSARRCKSPAHTTNGDSWRLAALAYSLWICVELIMPLDGMSAGGAGVFAEPPLNTELFRWIVRAMYFACLIGAALAAVAAFRRGTPTQKCFAAVPLLLVVYHTVLILVGLAAIGLGAFNTP